MGPLDFGSAFALTGEHPLFVTHPHLPLLSYWAALVSGINEGKETAWHGRQSWTGSHRIASRRLAPTFANN